MQFLIANAGLPMIGVQMNIMIMALIPIVAIEAIVMRTRLSRTNSQCFQACMIANCVSTFVGIPLAWMAMVIIEISIGGSAWGLDTPVKRILAVTIQAPLLIPYEDARHWMVPAASLVLMFPFLVVSALVESRVLFRLWPELPRKEVTSTTWLANALTYSILIAFCGIGLYRSLRPHS